MSCRIHYLFCTLTIFVLWGCATPDSPPSSPGLPPSSTSQPERVETPPLSSDASAVLIPTEGNGVNRAEAEKNGLTKAVRDGLRQYMCAEWATDQTVTAYIQRRLAEIALAYDPLVKRWMLNVNQPRKGGHYMQGTLALDTGVLKRWADAWLQELSISWTGEVAPLIHRLSLYIVPSSLEEIDLSRDDLKRRQQFMHALENKLSRSGYQIKRDAYRAQAQYQLKLAESIFEESGLIKSMTFTVQILDNAADQALLATASGYAAADIDVTEGIVRKELLESAANKVAAELYCKFLFLALSKPPTEIVFYLPQNLPRNRTQDQLYQGLARIYGQHTPTALESFKVKVHSKHAPVQEKQTFSFLMPASYRIPHSQLERELIKLHEGVVQTPESVIERASGGKIWHVLKAAKPPPVIATAPHWRANVMALIREGKLDSPPGQSARDLVRIQLRAGGNQAQALEALDDIASALVGLAYDAMDKGFAAQAGRYLNRAERVLDSHLGQSQVRQEIRTARDAVHQRHRQSSPPPPPPVQPKRAPWLVFPDLAPESAREAKTIGGPRSKPKAIIGLAADADNIADVMANGKRLTFRAATGSYKNHLEQPLVPTQQFQVPLELQNRDGTINVIVTDRDGQTTQRLLRVDDRGVTLLAANTIERGRDILENGYYWALLLANQNYTHVADLSTPFHDVDQLSALLIDKYGFARERVLIVKDATQSEMRKKLEWIHDRVEENDSLLIYYAGHGVQENAYGGKGFWVPIDGEAPSKESPYRATWLPNILVHQAMQVSRAKHILLISDSCYSGTFRTEFTRTRGGFAQDEEFFCL